MYTHAHTYIQTETSHSFALKFSHEPVKYNNTQLSGLEKIVGAHLCSSLYFYLNYVFGKWDMLRLSTRWGAQAFYKRL